MTARDIMNVRVMADAKQVIMVAVAKIPVKEREVVKPQANKLPYLLV
jgi:hypothetical protein